jgi:hypothetical protein
VRRSTIGRSFYSTCYLALVLLDVGTRDANALAQTDARVCRNLPIGVVVLVALAIFLRVKGEVTEQRALTLREKLMRMDFAGCLTFLAAMCCILLALQWGGQTKPWNSATVIGLLIAGGVLAIIFVFTQHRLQDRALIPPRVFLQRSIWTGASVLFFLGAAIYAVRYPLCSFVLVFQS